VVLVTTLIAGVNIILVPDHSIAARYVVNIVNISFSVMVSLYEILEVPATATKDESMLFAVTLRP
jgi:hypothetical protein